MKAGTKQSDNLDAILAHKNYLPDASGFESLSEIFSKSSDDEDDEQDENTSDDKFREPEIKEDHRDIPEIGEEEKEIEPNTPRKV